MGQLKEFFSVDRRFFDKLRQDSTAKSLLGANLVIVLLTVIDNWDLGFALIVYWWQNVIIGVFNVLKIMAFPDEVIASFKSPNPSKMSPVGIKVVLAGFFALHYGFFHFGYFSFLQFFVRGVNPLWVFISIAVFFVQGAYLFLYNKNKASSPEDLQRLFLFPYFRIVPMHIIIMVGMAVLFIMHGILGEKMGAMIGEKIVLVIFMILKIKADIQMHHAENDPDWKPKKGSFGEFYKEEFHE